MDELFVESTSRTLHPDSVGNLFNGGVTAEGQLEYAGTTKLLQKHGNKVLYLGVNGAVSKAYAKAAAFVQKKRGAARKRKFKLDRDLHVLWVNARDIFMGPEEEEFLNQSEYDGIAQHNDKNELTELVVKQLPNGNFPVTLLRDEAAAAFIDL